MDINDRRVEVEIARDNIVKQAHAAGERIIMDGSDGSTEMTDRLTAEVAVQILNRTLRLAGVPPYHVLAGRAVEATMGVIIDRCATLPEPVRNYIMIEVARRYFTSVSASIGSALLRYDNEHPPKLEE